MPQAGASGGGSGMPTSDLWMERAWRRRAEYVSSPLPSVPDCSGPGEPPKSLRNRLRMSPTYQCLSPCAKSSGRAYLPPGASQDVITSRWGTPLAPVRAQLPYLAVHLVEGFAYPDLQPRPAVVGEVARQPP